MQSAHPDFAPFMAPWRGPREGKVVGVEDAIAAIPDRSRVFVSQVCSVPVTLIDALNERRGRFSRLELVTAYLLDPLPVFDHPHEPFVLTSLQACRAARAMIDAGACSIVPASLSQWPDLLSAGGPLAPDVALVQVSALGPDGRFSLGTGTGPASTSCARRRSSSRRSTRRCPTRSAPASSPGTTSTSSSTSTTRCRSCAPQPVSDLERTIAGHAAQDIHDSATLQFGIGAVPAAIMSVLGDLRDLGLHGGMLGDACIDLVESGAITGSRKSIDPFLHVGGEVLGSTRLFEWVHRNEHVMTVPARYSHGPANLARIDDFVAINSTVEIALDGAVGAEVAGGQVISGPGGQPDFALGASMSRGGISILGLPATASRGRISRIVEALDPAAPVTVPRYLADRVVTEYGVARLKGLDLAQRAEALRRIAHPDFHGQLA